MKIEISLTALILVWLAVSLFVFATLVGDRQSDLQPSSSAAAEVSWCGDLFMVVEKTKEGYVHYCTGDYGDD